MKRYPRVYLLIATVSALSTALSSQAAPDPVLRARQSAMREGFPGFFQILKTLTGERARIRDVLAEKPFPVEAGDYRARGLFSTLFLDPDTRRDTLPLIEQSLAERSRRTRDFLMEDNREVDVMIVGAGPEGAAALDELTRRSPELAKNAMVIDQKNGAGGQFREGGDLWYLNSPDRTETGQLPGSGGNLNRFVKWLSSTLFSGRNWPTAGKVAEVAQAAHYASPVNVAFSTRLVKVESAEGDRTRVTLELLDEAGKPIRQVTVLARAVIDTTGLGADKVNFRLDEKLRQSGVFYGFNDIVRKFGPYGDHGIQSTAGKSVAIIGGGDSGKVIAELLTRVGPEGAYKNSPSQLGGPEKIVWYVSDKQFETCIEYFLTERKRYALLLGAISSGRLQIARGQVEAVESRPDGKAEITYNARFENGPSDGPNRNDSRFSGRKKGVIFTRTQPKKGKLTVEDLVVKGDVRESAAAFDMVISTTGLKSETFAAFPNPAEAGTKEGWSIIEGKIGGKLRRIARRSLQVPGYVRVGPANEGLGALVDPDEILGATANTVSIFLNAPRVAETVAQIAGGLTASDPKTSDRLVNFDNLLARDQRMGKNQSLPVGAERPMVAVDANEGSLVRNASNPERVLKAELSRLTGRLNGNQELVLRFRSQDGGITVALESSQGFPQISAAQLLGDRMLSQLLARNYFGTVKDRAFDLVARIGVRDSTIANSKGTLEVTLARLRNPKPAVAGAESENQSPLQVRASVDIPPLVRAPDAPKSESPRDFSSYYSLLATNETLLEPSLNPSIDTFAVDGFNPSIAASVLTIRDPFDSGRRINVLANPGNGSVGIKNFKDQIVTIRGIQGEIRQCLISVPDTLLADGRQYATGISAKDVIAALARYEVKLPLGTSGVLGFFSEFDSRKDGRVGYAATGTGADGNQATWTFQPLLIATNASPDSTIAVEGFDPDGLVASIDVADPRFSGRVVRILANPPLRDAVSSKIFKGARVVFNERFLIIQPKIDFNGSYINQLSAAEMQNLIETGAIELPSALGSQLAGQSRPQAQPPLVKSPVISRFPEFFRGDDIRADGRASYVREGGENEGNTRVWEVAPYLNGELPVQPSVILAVEGFDPARETAAIDLPDPRIAGRVVRVIGNTLRPGEISRDIFEDAIVSFGAARVLLSFPALPENLSGSAKILDSLGLANLIRELGQPARGARSRGAGSL